MANKEIRSGWSPILIIMTIAISGLLIALLAFGILQTRYRLAEFKKLEKEIGKRDAKVKENISVIDKAVIVEKVKWKIGKPERLDALPGGEFLEPVETKGAFIKMTFDAELIGKRPTGIDQTQLELIDSKGRHYTISDEAGAPDDEVFVSQQMQPNVPIDGNLIFEVAKDATGLKLQIKDTKPITQERAVIELE